LLITEFCAAGLRLATTRSQHSSQASSLTHLHDSVCWCLTVSHQETWLWQHRVELGRRVWSPRSYFVFVGRVSWIPSTFSLSWILFARITTRILRSSMTYIKSLSLYW
jgi:hypothetical protein